MRLVSEVLKRSIALIVLRVSGTLAAGSLLGAEIWVSAGIAAFLGIIEVSEQLARAFVTDGKLTMREINSAFIASAQVSVDEDQRERARVMAEEFLDDDLDVELAEELDGDVEPNRLGSIDELDDEDDK